jgi:hypothetical protein
MLKETGMTKRSRGSFDAEYFVEREVNAALPTFKTATLIQKLQFA